MYRTVVIGRGLIGSAATRHLAEMSEGVACIGPDEPQDRTSHQGVFASHYDEGRMTRINDPEFEWAITAKRSIERYADIEARSGIKVFTPAGYLGIGSPATDYNARCAAVSGPLGARSERLSATEIAKRFAYLSVDEAADGLFETGTAGHISPRAMVAAESKLAKQAGAELIRSAATSIHLTRSGVEVECGDGQIVKAERALVATGAFTAACGLVPEELDFTVYGRTVVLARVEGLLLDKLKDMPTLIGAERGAYILPPIRYADGLSYLKMGIGTETDPRMRNLGQLQNWFKSAGSEDNRVEFMAFLKNLIPELEAVSHWHTDTCAATQTASKLPVIDFVEPGRLAVAVGGNGKGAKGADDWGWIAAQMLEGNGEASPVELSKLAYIGGRGDQ